MKKPMVKLNDGTQVSLEEFIKWTPKRQEFKTRPLEEIKAISDKIKIRNQRAVNTPLGRFSSMTEAIEKTKIRYARLRSLLLNPDNSEYSYVISKPEDLEYLPKKLQTPDQRKAVSAIVGLTKRRAVNTPTGQFSSVNEAAKALSIAKGVLRYFCLNTAYPKYSYVNPTPQEIAKQFYKVHKVGPKKTVTPIGTFKSKIAAANALGILKDQLGKLMTTNPNEYYYAEDSVNRSHEFLNVSGIDPVKGYRLPKVIMTPSGPFPSKLQAALAYFMPSKQFDVLLELEPDKFYFIKRKK